LSQQSRYWEALEAQAETLKGLDRPRIQLGLKAMWFKEPRRHNEQFTSTIRVVKTVLSQGASFYWSPQTLDLVQEATKTMPAWTLTPESLPAPHGFFYFGKSLPLPQTDAPDAPLRAVGWISMSGKTESAAMYLARGEQAPDRIAVVYFQQIDDSLAPVTVVEYQPNETLNEAAERYRKELQDAQDYKQSSEAAYWRKMQYWACCLSFLEQRIMGRSRARTLPRAVRRRLEIERQPEIQIVYLRRLVSPIQHLGRLVEAEHESRLVDWKVQWIVSGHWRQQWYPTKGVHKPKYINPYLKGPTGKPLQSAVKLFAVKR